jgi:hypothetical protein
LDLASFFDKLNSFSKRWFGGRITLGCKKTDKYLNVYGKIIKKYFLGIFILFLYNLDLKGIHRV